jgi:hypothetical protein
LGQPVRSRFVTHSRLAERRRYRGWFRAYHPVAFLDGAIDRSRSVDSGSATVDPVTSEDTFRALDDWIRP